MSELKSPFIEKYSTDIQTCIAGFDINTANYKYFKPDELGLKGDSSNSIFIRGDAIPAGLELIFTEKAKNCTVFINDGFTGKGNKFSLKNEGNLLYLGNNLSINKVSAVILGHGDAILVGNGISITSSNSWSTGFNAGNKYNGLIIGDDCLIASEIVIRPADGHIVFDTATGEQTNKSHYPIIIEPYCWIAQRAAILKNVRIGACSIVSFAAVVTKSCDRFSAVAGVPGKAIPLNGKMWLRGRGKDAKRIQEIYMSRFGNGKILEETSSSNNETLIT